MRFALERSRRRTDRLAALLADARGGETLAELQKLQLSLAPPTTPAVSDGGESTRIGPWEIVREETGTALRRRPLPAAEARFWSQGGDVPVAPEARRVVLLGESMARGFLTDPVVTPAGLLERWLTETAGDASHQCVDLARTGTSLEEVEEIVKRLPALEPDVVVLMCGNNWAHPRYTVGALDVLGRALHDGGYELLRESFWRAVVLPRIARLLERLGWLGESGAELVVVIPEFNLAEWAPEPGFETPVLRDEDLARWIPLRERAAELLAADRWQELLATAEELERLDGGLSPVSSHLRGRALLALGRNEEARSALEQSRDAGCGLLVSHSPRCPRPIQEQLAAFASEHGAACVDLRELLRDEGSRLPDAGAFLDYCHLSIEGQLRATRAIAAAVLGVEPAAEAVNVGGRRHEHAAAHLMAAMHNAYSGQPRATLVRHLERGLALAGGDAADLCRFRRFLVGSAPAWADRAFNELCRLPNARRYLAANVEGRVYGFESLARRALVDALAEVLPDRVEAAPVRAQDLLRAGTTGTSVRERAGVTYEEQRGYVQAAAACSRFRIDGAPADGFDLELVLRVPGLETPGRVVEITLNGKPLAAVVCSPRWSRSAIALDAELLAETNELVLRWPPPVAQYDDRQAADAAALGRGEFPGVLPSTGEIAVLRATPRRRSPAMGVGAERGDAAT